MSGRWHAPGAGVVGMPRPGGCRRLTGRCSRRCSPPCWRSSPASSCWGCTASTAASRRGPWRMRRAICRGRRRRGRDRRRMPGAVRLSLRGRLVIRCRVWPPWVGPRGAGHAAAAALRPGVLSDGGGPGGSGAAVLVPLSAVLARGGRGNAVPASSSPPCSRRATERSSSGRNASRWRCGASRRRLPSTWCRQWPFSTGTSA